MTFYPMRARDRGPFESLGHWSDRLKDDPEDHEALIELDDDLAEDRAEELRESE